MRKISLLTISVLIACGCGSPAPLAGSWDMVSTHPGQANRFVFDASGGYTVMSKSQANEASPVLELDVSGKYTLINNKLTITPDPKTITLKGGNPQQEKEAKSAPLQPLSIDITWVNSDEFKVKGAGGLEASYKRVK